MVVGSRHLYQRRRSAGLSTDELMDQILTAPLIQCDEVAWEFLTLSMASWNVLISLGLAGIWMLAAVRYR